MGENQSAQELAPQVRLLRDQDIDDLYTQEKACHMLWQSGGRAKNKGGEHDQHLERRQCLARVCMDVRGNLGDEAFCKKIHRQHLHVLGPMHCGSEVVKVLQFNTGIEQRTDELVALVLQHPAGSYQDVHPVPVCTLRRVGEPCQVVVPEDAFRLVFDAERLRQSGHARIATMDRFMSQKTLRILVGLAGVQVELGWCGLCEVLQVLARTECRVSTHDVSAETTQDGTAGALDLPEVLDLPLVRQEASETPAQQARRPVRPRDTNPNRVQVPIAVPPPENVHDLAQNARRPTCYPLDALGLKDPEEKEPRRPGPKPSRQLRDCPVYT